MRSLRTALSAALALVSWSVRSRRRRRRRPAPLIVTGERSVSEVTRVVVISVDGLNPRRDHPARQADAPTFHRLVAEGATTFNARSEVELTLTLPNHTGMVTSRRVDRSRGGHGVTWNDERLRPRTVQAAAGHPVGSVFSSLETAGLGSAMFAAKPKFTLFNRSWPNEHRPHADQGRQRRSRQGRPERPGDHLAGPHVPAHLAARRRRSRPRLDVAGVPRGGPTVRLPGRPRARHHRRDRRVARPHARRRHRRPRRHRSQPLRPAQVRQLPVPFLVWGPGVPAGADLYDLNPTYADPGRLRVGYGTADAAGPQRRRRQPGPRRARPARRSPTASSTSTRTSRSSRRYAGRGGAQRTVSKPR